MNKDKAKYEKYFNEIINNSTEENFYDKFKTIMNEALNNNYEIVIQCIKKYIKSKYDSKGKYFCLFFIKELMDQNNEKIQLFWLNKIFSRLFKISKSNIKSKDLIIIGQKCLNNYNNKSNPEYSLKFYILLMECWIYWNSKFSNKKFDKIKKYYIKLLKENKIIKFDINIFYNFYLYEYKNELLEQYVTGFKNIFNNYIELINNQTNYNENFLSCLYCWYLINYENILIFNKNHKLNNYYIKIFNEYKDYTNLFKSHCIEFKEKKIDFIEYKEILNEIFEATENISNKTKTNQENINISNNNSNMSPKTNNNKFSDINKISEIEISNNKKDELKNKKIFSKRVFNLENINNDNNKINDMEVYESISKKSSISNDYKINIIKCKDKTNSKLSEQNSFEKNINKNEEYYKNSNTKNDAQTPNQENNHISKLENNFSSFKNINNFSEGLNINADIETEEISFRNNFKSIEKKLENKKDINLNGDKIDNEEKNVNEPVNITNNKDIDLIKNDSNLFDDNKNDKVTNFDNFDNKEDDNNDFDNNKEDEFDNFGNNEEKDLENNKNDDNNEDDFDDFDNFDNNNNKEEDEFENFGNKEDDFDNFKKIINSNINKNSKKEENDEDFFDNFDNKNYDFKIEKNNSDVDPFKINNENINNNDTEFKINRKYTDNPINNNEKIINNLKQKLNNYIKENNKLIVDINYIKHENNLFTKKNELLSEELIKEKEKYNTNLENNFNNKNNFLQKENDKLTLALRNEQIKNNLITNRLKELKESYNELVNDVKNINIMKYDKINIEFEFLRNEIKKKNEIIKHKDFENKNLHNKFENNKKELQNIKVIFNKIYKDYNINTNKKIIEKKMKNPINEENQLKINFSKFFSIEKKFEEDQIQLYYFKACLLGNSNFLFNNNIIEIYMKSKKFIKNKFEIELNIKIKIDFDYFSVFFLSKCNYEFLPKDLNNIYENDFNIKIIINSNPNEFEFPKINIFINKVYLINEFEIILPMNIINYVKYFEIDDFNIIENLKENYYLFNYDDNLISCLDDLICWNKTFKKINENELVIGVNLINNIICYIKIQLSNNLRISCYYEVYNPIIMTYLKNFIWIFLKHN